MEWSIQDISRLAGTTSRTLRHYGDVGLLAPSRVGSNGYRYYDAAALTRLQRILLLRELGLSLPAIADVLAGQRDNAQALVAHRDWLVQEKDRLDRQIASVETTIRKLKGGEQLMAEEVFDGFDHTQYQDEVVERWGKAAYESSDRWWRSKTAAEKKEYAQQQQALAADWMTAAGSGIAADSDEAQALARRHAQWLSGIPGLPGGPAGPTKEYLAGLGELYVNDDRFAANYGGTDGARFVRDALAYYAEHSL